MPDCAYPSHKSGSVFHEDGDLCPMAGVNESSSGGRGMMTAEQLAQFFHESYERLAPWVGYKTREESAKPWANVPEQNRKLMTAVCAEVLTLAAAQLAEKEREIKRLQSLVMALRPSTLEARAVQAEERLKEAQADLKADDLDMSVIACEIGSCDAIREDIVKRVRALRQREAELEQRWIAVGERLPVCGEWHLDDEVAPLQGSRASGIVLACQSGEVYWAQFSENTDDGGKTVAEGGTGWDDRNTDDPIEPTHWQPLPSPPKEAK